MASTLECQSATLHLLSISLEYVDISDLLSSPFPSTLSLWVYTCLHPFTVIALEVSCSLLHVSWPCLPPWEPAHLGPAPFSQPLSSSHVHSQSYLLFQSLAFFFLSFQSVERNISQCSFEVSKCTTVQGPGKPVAELCTLLVCKDAASKACSPSNTTLPTLASPTFFNATHLVQSLSWCRCKGHGLSLGRILGVLGTAEAISVLCVSCLTTAP